MDSFSCCSSFSTHSAFAAEPPTGSVQPDEQILARAIEFDGPLDVTRPVTFRGGFNADFSDNSGNYSILKGMLTIGTGGRLNAEGLKVKALQ